MAAETPQDPSKAPDSSKTQGAMQGEGNYDAARKFDQEEAAFAKSGKVDAAAKAAKEALDGPEAADLEAARVSTGKGETHKPS